MGEVAVVGSGERPEDGNSEIQIRSDVLRVFCLGRDPDAPVHERGVRLLGAWITGDLDLDGCIVPHPLNPNRCHFEGRISLVDTSARQLGFGGSTVLGVLADRLDCRGSVLLRNGFISKEAVRFPGAKIGGALVCSKGSFEVTDGYALIFDSAKIVGDVFLDDGFIAKGQVRLLGATIGGDLVCRSGSFEAAGGDALCCDGARISGSVFLSYGFVAKGEVRLLGVVIEGDLSCSQGTFEANEGDALSLDRAKVAGDVFLNNGFVATSRVSLPGAVIDGDLSCSRGRFTALSLEQARVAGNLIIRADFQASHVVNLAKATIGVLADERSAWEGPIYVLDGLTWTSFGGSSPTDAESRIKWLSQQPYSHLSFDFRQQPWEQCANSLEQLGRLSDANRLRIEKRRRMRWLAWNMCNAQNTDERDSYANRILRIFCKISTLPGVYLDYLQDIFVGYGFRPIQFLLWMPTFWILAATFYAYTIPAGIMAPTDALVYQSSAIPAECRDDWIDFKPKFRVTDDIRRREMSEQLGLMTYDRDDHPVSADWPTICKASMPSEYTTFSPAVYALDLLLPIIDLRQEKDWAPRVTDERGNVVAPIVDGWGWGYVTRIIEWMFVLLGWFFSALLAGAVSGLIRRG